VVRHYRKKTGQLPPERRLRVRATRCTEIDPEKIAEVLIRVALREADQRDAGAYLRDHLAEPN